MLVMLRNASRGAFLASLAGGLYVVLVARGRAPPLCAVGRRAGGVDVPGDHETENREAMFARFMTTFAPEEQREISAESRSPVLADSD